MHRAQLSWWIPVVVITILAGSIGVLSGCRVIGDPSDRLSLERSATAVCITECNSDHLELIKDEIELHRAEIEECQALAESEREACLEAEAVRHQAVMEQIAAGRSDCNNDCHRQGNGGGH